MELFEAWCACFVWTGVQDACYLCCLCCGQRDFPWCALALCLSPLPIPLHALIVSLMRSLAWLTCPFLCPYAGEHNPPHVQHMCYSGSTGWHAASHRQMDWSCTAPITSLTVHQPPVAVKDDIFWA